MSNDSNIEINSGLFYDATMLYLLQVLCSLKKNFRVLLGDRLRTISVILGWFIEMLGGHQLLALGLTAMFTLSMALFHDNTIILLSKCRLLMPEITSPTSPNDLQKDHLHAPQHQMSRPSQ